jgi:superfamily I DNA/RNA helicase
MLKDPQDGIFYVFFDDNQNVYQQIANLPIKNPPIPLTKNCRNTQEIHKIVTRYTSNQDTECIGPQGRPVEMNPAKDHKDAQEALRKVLHRLVNEQGISAQDIIMLTPRSDRTSRWKSDTQIGKFILTWDMATTMTDAIRLCTIYSFKGLESPVVILSELERANQDVNDALMYVGLSRARNQVLVIGELPEPT